MSSRPGTEMPPPVEATRIDLPDPDSPSSLLRSMVRVRVVPLRVASTFCTMDGSLLCELLHAQVFPIILELYQNVKRKSHQFSHDQQIRFWKHSFPKTLIPCLLDVVFSGIILVALW